MEQDHTREREYARMSTQELEELSRQFDRANFLIMQELIRRGWGRDLPDHIEDSDMHLTEKDF
jgi:hypothetical protein